MMFQGGAKQRQIVTEEPVEVLDSLFLKAPRHSARMAPAEEVSSDLNRQPAGSKPVSLFFWLQPFPLAWLS